MKVMIVSFVVVLIFGILSGPVLLQGLTLADITHNSGEIMYANPVSGEIRVKVKKGAAAEVTLVNIEKAYQMNLVFQDDAADYFQADLGRFDTSFVYHFIIKSGTDSVLVPRAGDFTSRALVFETPAWAAGKSFYTIMPDGFFDGDAMSNPSGALAWGSRADKWTPYGGDLTGIALKLAYLDSLNFDILILSPIFKAASNHKHNPQDYLTIDPAFGDTIVFKILINEIHKRQKRIILSVPVTQVGIEFAPFSEALKEGPASKYWVWFSFSSTQPRPEPGYYECWLNDHRLPRLNLADGQLRSRLLSYLDFWARFGLDGFYLGEDPRINHDFLREARAALKAKYPDLLLLGSDSQANAGDGLDGGAHAYLNRLLSDLFVRDSITLTEFDQRYRRFLFLNPAQSNVITLLNTSSYLYRLAAVMPEDGIRLFYAFIFTACGAPNILYGDEIGLADGAPLNPGSYNWASDRQNRELLLDLKKLIYIRQTNPQIATKYFYTLYVNDLNRVYAYDRGGIITILNLGAAATYLELPAWDGTYLDLVSGERFTAAGQKLRLSIGSRAYRILRRGV